MRLLFTPDVINIILDELKRASNTIQIYMPFNHEGKFLTKLVNILEMNLQNNVKINYVIENKFGTLSAKKYIYSKLGKYENFVMSSRSKFNEIDHIKFINVDNRTYFIGSFYFSDDMYIYDDAMLLFLSDNYVDKKYIDKFNIDYAQNDELVYISKPNVLNTNDDINNFILNSKNKLTIIVPYIYSLFVNNTILETIKKISEYVDVKIILPNRTNLLMYDIYHNIEFAFMYKNKFNILYSDKHFHYKIFIRDDKDLLMSTGNINIFNGNYFDINIKLYDMDENLLDILRNKKLNVKIDL